MTDVLTTQDARTLLDLCHAGRLFEIEKWIADGRSIHVPAEFRSVPLCVAVNRGFHSLVELLARNANQDEKNTALNFAVSCKRRDLIELLLAHGAALHSVPFRHVLFTWEPSVIRLFLDRGADAVTDRPFAHAFCERIRTALRPFIDYKKAHPELAPQLQEQADCALRHFCREHNLKWTCLMMWAGADPRSNGPSMNEEYDDHDDPELWETAFASAAYADDVAILKALKPDPARDNLAEPLKNAALFARVGTVKFLLGLGVKPGAIEDGGSSIIAACLGHIGWKPLDRFPGHISRWSCESSIECIRLLVEHGARWAPHDSSELNHVRRQLLQCEPRVTIDLIRLLADTKACTIEVIQGLVRTERIRQHLKPMDWHITRLKLPLWKEPRKVNRPAVSAHLLQQYDRARLYEQVWTEPMRAIAKFYGVSDVWLAKVCRCLRVPLPGRGYWARKAAGLTLPKRPSLPSLKPR